MAIASESCEHRLLLTTANLHIDIFSLRTFEHLDDGIDDNGDFYVKIGVESRIALDTSEQTITGTFAGSSEVVSANGAWSVTVPVNAMGAFSGYSLVTIEVLDKDGGLNGADDIIDINPDLGATALLLSVDPITGHWYTAYPNSTWPSMSASGILDGDSGGTVNFGIRSDFLNPSKDADGDGIPNSWEVDGIDVDDDGEIDFQLDGDDPFHKDIFVEVDAMLDRAPAELPPISLVSNTSPVVVTSPAHGLTTGTKVQITGVTGTTSANGTFTVTRLSNDRFQLDGSTGNGAYTGSGAWALADLPTTGAVEDVSHIPRFGNGTLPDDVEIYAPNHGLYSGQRVQISNLQGADNRRIVADGIYTITRRSPRSFILNNTSTTTSLFVGGGAYLGAGSWTLIGPDRPTGTVLDLVVDAFRRAPVENPDFSTGIHLHILRDDWNLPLVSWFGDVDGDGRTAFGEDTNANGTLDPGEDTLVANGRLDEGDRDEWGGRAHFQALRNSQFGTTSERSNAKLIAAKKLAYRYAVFADQKIDPVDRDESDSGVRTGSSGTSYGQYGFAITMGAFFSATSTDNAGGRPDEQAGTFMHELGHSLGLGHGGSSREGNVIVRDETNYKPNYNSVMNYLWQLPNAAMHSESAWSLDYSRAALPDLNESDLDENTGLGGNAAFRVAIGPRSTTSAAQLVNAGGAVDFDGDGILETSVSRDLNRIGANSDPSEGDLLKGRDDWSVLLYSIGITGSGGGLANVSGDEPNIFFRDLLDNELLNPVRFSIDDATVLEGNTGASTATFRIRLDRASYRTTAVSWAVAFGGTATPPELSGTLSGTATFLPGETEKLISANVVGDTLMERDESLL